MRAVILRVLPYGQEKEETDEWGNETVETP